MPEPTGSTAWPSSDASRRATSVDLSRAPVLVASMPPGAMPMPFVSSSSASSTGSGAGDDITLEHITNTLSMQVDAIRETSSAAAKSAIMGMASAIRAAIPGDEHTSAIADAESTALAELEQRLSRCASGFSCSLSLPSSSFSPSPPQRRSSLGALAPAPQAIAGNTTAPATFATEGDGASLRAERDRLLADTFVMAQQLQEEQLRVARLSQHIATLTTAVEAGSERMLHEGSASEAARAIVDDVDAATGETIARATPSSSTPRHRAAAAASSASALARRSSQTAAAALVRAGPPAPQGPPGLLARPAPLVAAPPAAFGGAAGGSGGLARVQFPVAPVGRSRNRASSLDGAAAACDVTSSPGSACGLRSTRPRPAAAETGARSGGLRTRAVGGSEAAHGAVPGAAQASTGAARSAAGGGETLLSGHRGSRGRQASSTTLASSEDESGGPGVPAGVGLGNGAGDGLMAGTAGVGAWRHSVAHAAEPPHRRGPTPFFAVGRGVALGPIEAGAGVGADEPRPGRFGSPLADTEGSGVAQELSAAGATRSALGSRAGGAGASGMQMPLATPGSEGGVVLPGAGTASSSSLAAGGALEEGVGFAASEAAGSSMAAQGGGGSRSAAASPAGVPAGLYPRDVSTSVGAYQGAAAAVVPSSAASEAESESDRAVSAALLAASAASRIGRVSSRTSLSTMAAAAAREAASPCPALVPSTATALRDPPGRAATALAPSPATAAQPSHKRPTRSRAGSSATETADLADTAVAFAVAAVTSDDSLSHLQRTLDDDDEDDEDEEDEENEEAGGQRVARVAAGRGKVTPDAGSIGTPSDPEAGYAVRGSGRTSGGADLPPTGRRGSAHRRTASGGSGSSFGGGSSTGNVAQATAAMVASATGLRDSGSVGLGMRMSPEVLESLAMEGRPRAGSAAAMSQAHRERTRSGSFQAEEAALLDAQRELTRSHGSDVFGLRGF